MPKHEEFKANVKLCTAVNVGQGEYNMAHAHSASSIADYELQHFRERTEEWFPMNMDVPANDDAEAVQFMKNHIGSHRYARGMRFRIVKRDVLSTITVI